MRTHQLLEDGNIYGALKPASDAAGRAGRYVALTMVNEVAIVVHIDQGDAAPVPLSITQAQDFAGTGAKPLEKAARIWVNLDAAASDALVRVADDVAYTTDASLKEKLVLFLVPARALGMTNGFRTLRLNTGASHAANIVGAYYVATGARYAGEGGQSLLTLY